MLCQTLVFEKKIKEINIFNVIIISYKSDVVQFYKYRNIPIYQNKFLWQICHIILISCIFWRHVMKDRRTLKVQDRSAFCSTQPTIPCQMRTAISYSLRKLSLICGLRQHIQSHSVICGHYYILFKQSSMEKCMY